MDRHKHMCAFLFESRLRHSNVEKQTVLTLSGTRWCICQCCIVPERVYLNTNLAIWSILNTCRAIVYRSLRRRESQGSEGRGGISDVWDLEICWVFLYKSVWEFGVFGLGLLVILLPVMPDEEHSKINNRRAGYSDNFYCKWKQEQCENSMHRIRPNKLHIETG